ncbi:MAG: DUF4172 domain-containing protein, partial [Phycisphaeraceae bacterium]
GGVILGAVSHLQGDERDRLTVPAIRDEAVTTSEIEGELLDRDRVQPSIQRALGLPPDARRASAAEQGVAEMMMQLHRTTTQRLDQDMLCAWHGMLMRGRRDLGMIGAYRTHREPMRVVSGRVHDPTASASLGRAIPIRGPEAVDVIGVHQTRKGWGSGGPCRTEGVRREADWLRRAGRRTSPPAPG